MSKSKKKKDKKDKKDSGKQDKDTSDNANSAANVAETKIATLTFSNESLRSQLKQHKNNYETVKENSDKSRIELTEKIESQQEIISFLEKTISDFKKNCNKYEEQHKIQKKLYNNLKIEKEILIEQELKK
eukprot:510150_1